MKEAGASPVDSDPQHERFSNGITDLYVTIEDLRQSFRSIETTTHSNEISNRKAFNGITIGLLQDWQIHVDRMVQITSFLLQVVPTTLDASTENSSAEKVEMLQHSIGKASDVTKQVLQFCCSQYIEPTHDDVCDEISLTSMEEQRRTGQAAVARIAEMSVILAFHAIRLASSPRSSTDSAGYVKTNHFSADTSKLSCMEEIVQHYVQFQRRTFRMRCKPSIAQLVDLRCQQNMFASPDVDISSSHGNSSSIIDGVHVNDVESERVLRRSEHEQRYTVLLKQYHAPVFTVVLGVAATLIHPLAAWMANISSSKDEMKTLERTIPSFIHELCAQSVSVIHEQTEALVKSISDWFYLDRKYIFDLSSSLDDVTLNTMGSIHTMPRERHIGLLTAVVDEMAYVAQILERYRTLVDSCASEECGVSLSRNNLIAKSILPEWIWQYSSLERRLVVLQWQMSVIPLEGSGIGATPVEIVIGTDIRVSSCIEDAQYITSRAMERAVSTQSLHAIATIAYAIVHDIWATESLKEQASQCFSITVYKALLEEIGCWVEPDSSLVNGSDAKKLHTATSPSSGGFATALLDALDEDMGQPRTMAPARNSSSNSASPSNPPRSGGARFLSSLITSSAENEQSSHQRQLDTLFCVCNSLYAAAGACRGLSKSLDEILRDFSQYPPGISVVKSDGNLSSGQRSPIHVTEGSASQCEIVKKAVSLILLARDELLLYSSQYQELLTIRIGESVSLWCFRRSFGGSIGRSIGCLDVLREFFANENYEINGLAFAHMEADERLEHEMLKPLKQNPLLRQLTHKCEAPIIQLFSERVAIVVVELLLHLLWMKDGIDSSDVNTETNDPEQSRNPFPPMRFTDWGALLLSKQSRMLQHYISVTLTQRNDDSSTFCDNSNGSAAKTGTSITVFQIWERLSQVITILQLEKPMDWLIYHSTSKLTPDEVSRTMRLRVDFSNEAIEKVVTDLRSMPASTKTL